MHRNIKEGVIYLSYVRKLLAVNFSVIISTVKKLSDDQKRYWNCSKFYLKLAAYTKQVYIHILIIVLSCKNYLSCIQRQSKIISCSELRISQSNDQSIIEIMRE